MSKSTSTNSNSNSEDEYDDRDIDWSYELINNYLLLYKLGQGAYCSVWLAYNCEKNIYCALKIYNREDLERGEREINVYNDLKKLNISNIVVYNNTFKHNNNSTDEIFLCTEMPLCGYSIYNLIEIFDNSIPINFIYKIIQNVILILHNLHSKNYVHADIKPENILLSQPTYENFQIIETMNNILKSKKINKITKKNKDEIIKLIKKALKNKIIDDSTENIQNYILTNFKDVVLCDMGTAVKPGDPKLYKKYTIYYRAPETILQLKYNHTYDYWSLGCTLYEILTGDILFDVDNDLELLYNFTSKIGPLPINLLKTSDMSQMFYNKKLNRLRGYKNINFDSIYSKLLNLINENNFLVMQKIINIIISCLDYNYLTRTIRED
jgi:serine/threonine protein kinase